MTPDPIQPEESKPGSPDGERSPGLPERPSADEAARLELAHHVELYKFHASAYIQGIAFFLAINAALFKFAIDDRTNRGLYSEVALLCGIAIVIPLAFSYWHIGRMRRDFDRLANATSTSALSVAPLAMLSFATTIFWLVIVGTWIRVYALR
jgi:hypothetical protein